MKKIERDELNAMAALWNKKRKMRNVKSESGREIFLSTLNLYLFLCRQNDYSSEQYEIVKNALQDIADWYSVGLDIETFELTTNSDAVLTDRTLIELDVE